MWLVLKLLILILPCAGILSHLGLCRRKAQSDLPEVALIPTGSWIHIHAFKMYPNWLGGATKDCLIGQEGLITRLP